MALQPEPPSGRPHGTSGLFYGWVVVGSAFSILALAYGVQYSFGVFVPLIVDELGWQRATLGGAFSLYAMIYLGVTVFAGRLSDVLGPRLVISAGGILIGIGLIGTSRATAEWELFFWYGLVAALGMSTAYIPCNITVARWFERRRGLAVGLSSSGSSCGIFLIPLLVVFLVSTLDWRQAMGALGAGLLLLTLVAARFMVRSPEDVGLKPDGATATEDAGDHREPAELTMPNSTPVGLTFRGALKTRPLWVFIIGFAIALVPMTVPFVHLSVFAIDLGLPRSQGAAAVSVIGLIALVGGIALGALSDRIGLKPTFLLALAAQGVAYLLLLTATTAWMMFLGATFFGIFYGGFSATFPGLMVYLFGPRSAGTIGGFVISGGGLLGSWGPALVGYMRDVNGDYDAAFLFCFAMASIAVGVSTLLRKPGNSAPAKQS